MRGSAQPTDLCPKQQRVWGKGDEGLVSGDSGRTGTDLVLLSIIQHGDSIDEPANSVICHSYQVIGKL